MYRDKLAFAFLLGTFLICAGVLIWLSTPVQVAAQCGSDPSPESSCVICHQEEAPVYENGEWHGIHAKKDCCANCHGGNCRATDEDQAHQGMVVNPLSDTFTNCHSCHPDDYLTRAQVFSAELGIEAHSAPTSTPVPTGKMVSNPLIILPSPEKGITPDLSFSVVLGGVAVITLLMIGIIAIITHMHT